MVFLSFWMSFGRVERLNEGFGGFFFIVDFKKGFVSYSFVLILFFCIKHVL